MQQTSKIGDVIQKNGEKSSLHNKILWKCLECFFIDKFVGSDTLKSFLLFFFEQVKNLTLQLELVSIDLWNKVSQAFATLRQPLWRVKYKFIQSLLFDKTLTSINSLFFYSNITGLLLSFTKSTSNGWIESSRTKSLLILGRLKVCQRR
jgi:hypothetical protein